MEPVVVERELDEPLDLDALREKRDTLVTCMQAHNGSLQSSYVAPDGKRMICIYQAPGAESVRQALRTGGVLPFEIACKTRVVRLEDLAERGAKRLH